MGRRQEGSRIGAWSWLEEEEGEEEKVLGEEEVGEEGEEDVDVFGELSSAFVVVVAAVAGWEKSAA